MPPTKVVGNKGGVDVPVYLRSFEGDDMVQQQRCKFFIIQARVDPSPLLSVFNFFLFSHDRRPALSPSSSSWLCRMQMGRTKS
jgi:hypothetical protein